LRAALNRAWPVLDAAELVGDLWEVPAFLRKCAPWLTGEEVQLLRRPDARAWTVSDLPLLDAARLRLGDPRIAARERRRAALAAADRERMATVIDDILRADDDGEGAVAMLRGGDLRDSLVTVPETAQGDPLAGPFAHIVVDEAQELTDAEWQMLLRRCPSRSFTIAGDRAQARLGFTGSWAERLERAGFGEVRLASLRTNYRTPAEIMAEAEPVIRAALPDANVPVSIRTSGLPVVHGKVSELAAWLGRRSGGITCVIGAPRLPDTPRVRSLTPQTAKGLEFDLVVLVDPERLSAVDRYVAMTRATQQLVILTP
jgi:superfamily I DNA/RNA helicase